MRKEIFEKFMILLVLVAGLSLSATTRPAAGQQEARSDDQKCSGSWNGSYTNEDGATGNLSYVLAQNEKGQWRGKVKYTNQDGEQAGEFKLIEIADKKLKGKVDLHGGAIEATMEGELRGDQFSGTYTISAINSSDVMERGTWKVTRGSTAKPTQ